MTYVPSNQDSGFFEGRSMRTVRARWSRLSMSDLAQIKTKDQLIARVEELYPMPTGTAARDVEIWRLDRHS